MKDFCEEDYEVLKCSYCGTDMMVSEYEIPKRIQPGAKDLGIISLVAVYGSCPNCLTVKTSSSVLFKNQSVGYEKMHENATAVFGAISDVWLACLKSVSLEKIRADITEKTLFIRVTKGVPK